MTQDILTETGLTKKEYYKERKLLRNWLESTPITTIINEYLECDPDKKKTKLLIHVREELTTERILGNDT